MPPIRRNSSLPSNLEAEIPIRKQPATHLKSWLNKKETKGRAYKKWSNEDDQFLEEHIKEYTNHGRKIDWNEIGQLLGHSVSGCTNRYYKLTHPGKYMNKSKKKAKRTQVSAAAALKAATVEKKEKQPTTPPTTPPEQIRATSEIKYSFPLTPEGDKKRLRAAMDNISLARSFFERG